MHPIRKQRLILIVSVVLSVAIAVGLILYALRSNISLFYTPSQVAQGETRPGQVFRLGGMVQKGSVQHGQGLAVRFVLTDFHHAIAVTYTGLLPDLFREGQGVVVQGQLEGGVLLAQEVLAKHDENYRPK
ncbi:MAG: cytochrome c maturation protein CcmE [Gammaproteobacteria bacterium]|nr:cytochrome c maturation protein CcmE [Gammaproteobacteria bacterium]